MSFFGCKETTCCSTWLLRQTIVKLNIINSFLQATIVMFNEIQKICCIDIYVADGAQKDLAKHVKSNNHAELFKIVRDK